MLAAALQFDVRAGEVEANLERVEHYLALAAARGCHLVVLPEMWPTSFLPEVGEADLEQSAGALARLAELSREHDLILCGTAYAAGESGASPTNRMHLFQNGAALAFYDKVHLFSPTAEQESFTAGVQPPPTVSTAHGRLTGVICYDLRFPELLRVPYRAGAEVLLVSAQWPTPRDSHWRALIHGRAVEGQCFVVACNRTGSDQIGRRRLALDFPGNSLLVSPHGERLAEGHGEEGLIVAELDLEVVRQLRVRVPVAKDERRDLYRAWDSGTRAAD